MQKGTKKSRRDEEECEEKKEIIQALVFNSLPSSSFNVIAIR
jgi:hypothetical protein